MALRIATGKVCSFQHLSRPDRGSTFSTTPRTLDPKPKDKPESDNPTGLEQRRNDWSIVKRLMIKLENAVDSRLWICAIGHGKVLNVQVPQIFKSVIDSLNVDITDSSTVWLLAGSLIVGYGAARIGATLSGELLNSVFASISQRAIRKVARDTFELVEPRSQVPPQ